MLSLLDFTMPALQEFQTNSRQQIQLIHHWTRVQNPQTPLAPKHLSLLRQHHRPVAWTSSHPSQAAPPAPAAQSPFVDSATRDVPTAPTGLPRGWNQQQAEPFTTPPPAPHRPAQGDGFVQPGASPHTRVQYMGDAGAMNRKDESLRKCDGSAVNFANWAKHFMDHMAKVHPAYRPALKWFSTTPEDLSFRRLHTKCLGPFRESAVDLADELEQCLVDDLTDNMYDRRVQLCGGKDNANNGLAMWRRLHSDFAGQGDVIEYAGVEVLRRYGRCNKLADLPSHIDGRLELLDQYGKELSAAPEMTRSMFLNIIPKDLKNEILKERSLADASHMRRADWCRNRAAVLQHEAVAEIVKKNLTNFSRGRINAVKQVTDYSDTEVPPPPPPPHLAHDVPVWAQSLIAAVTQRPAKTSTRKDDKASRGRTLDSGGNNRSRQSSPSPGARRNLVIGWGNKCCHSGSENHTRKDCSCFARMMAGANVGKPKDTWKPPKGFKSALGKNS